MQIIDVHCHLESDYFKDNLNTIIADAKNVGIIKLITCSINPPQWQTSKSIADNYKEVEFALGIHPWYISISDLDKIKDLYNAKNMGAVAIGEIGLDKNIENPHIDIQIEFFEKQLKIAKDIDLPLIMHCRNAFNELIHSIKKIGMPISGGIIHSFSGSAELAEQLIPYGVSFSLGGILTYRNSNKRIKLLKKIYPEHFLLETDSPDILPIPLKEKPNIPANIIYNLRAAAEIVGDSEEKVAFHTTDNAVKIFNLKLLV